MRPLCLLLLLTTTPAAAQQATITVPATPFTTLSVTADGRVERAPDIAEISAGVVTVSPTATAALSANAERMTSVIAALKRAGIADRDIQTSGLGVQPQYQYRDNQPPALTGYQATNNVRVRLHKIAEIGRLIDTLAAQGANQINGPTFQVDEPDAALDQARLQALSKARARADLYARAAGLRVERIVQIVDGPVVQPPYPMPMLRDQTLEAKLVSTPVTPGQVDLTATVTVVYELK